MFRKIYERIREFMVKFDDQPGGGLHNRNRDKRDFEFSSVFGYTPKNKFTENYKKQLRVNNQMGQNTCVLESGISQKEPDEGVELSPKMVAAYMRKNGLINSNGTSLSKFQEVLKNIGVCERKLVSENYQDSFDKFADFRILGKEVMDNANTHKSESYYFTSDLNTVLRNLDDGRVGQAGIDWYSGYNQNGGLTAPWILQMKKGIYRAGHAFLITDYILDYHGFDVLKCKNSYNEEWGDNGYFYIKFSDFVEIAKYGVYFNTDIPKNVAGWTSLYNKQAVKSAGDPKVYILDGGKKRHIPDEAIMWMLGITPIQITTTPNTTDSYDYVKDIPEGDPITINEFTPVEIEKVKYFVAMQKDDDFMKDRFAKYFPYLFNK